MKNKNKQRLEALEKIFAQPAPWQIEAQFNDGHIEILTAIEYAAVKLAQPDSVRAIGRKITGNLNELRAWLEMVHGLAFICDPNKEMEI